MDILRLLMSAFSRLTSAVTMPFRRLLYSVKRMLNVNVITAKIIRPLSKQIRKIATLKPAGSADYLSVGGLWVYKKAIYFIVLVLCAAVFLYFTMFADPVQSPPVSLVEVTTDITYAYDDLAVQSFTGVANIAAHDGTVVYTGEIAAGACRGRGILYDRTGTVLYAGEFDNNRYNGNGIQYFADGGVQYEGAFADNLYSGQGKLYGAGGALLYSGEFEAGKYEGHGKLYDESGVLLYEGDFADGLSSGNGTWYYENGGVRYTGEFSGGLFQGEGTLYAPSGKKLYSGGMHGGEINYEMLLMASLQDIEACFFETPRIFYMDDANGCFYFADAGIIISTDCRVMVHEWEREQDNISDGFYYMPDGYADYGTDAYGETGPVEDAPVYSGVVAVGTGLSSRVTPPRKLALAGAGRPAPVVRPMSWSVIDDPYSQPDESSSSSSQSSATSSSDHSSDEASSRQEEASGEPERSGAPEPESSRKESEYDSWPDFVERSKKLYFEIDTDVWQTEEELDRSKVTVRSVTVLGRQAPEGLEAAVDDYAPISLEDCIAVDAIRMQAPTAFSNIVFEMDKSNRLFTRVWNINYASRIERRTYAGGDLTYRYVYDPAGAEQEPLYFSLVR